MASEAWKEHSYNNSGSRNKDYYFSKDNHRDSNHKTMNNYHATRSRQTGLVEKLCQNYGFIECAEQELRVFFHYSQFKGNANDLDVGDSVEFEISSDSRTGKPVACRVSKLEQGSVVFEVKSEDRIQGIVEMEVKQARFNGYNTKSPSRNEAQYGRVSYGVNGESFFLSFSASDVPSNIQLCKGDTVSFHIMKNRRNSTVSAVDLLLVEAAPTNFVQGIVCSLKESFGFIERADKVSEIFFHYSEFDGDIGDLLLGDDVEFVVQDRNGKEVAVSVQRLPEGTVKFEDVSGDSYQGTVKQVFSRTKRQEPLNGKIVYATSTGQVELPYGEKDRMEEFTLFPGDNVGFKIATDRRDCLERATEIYLIKEVEAMNEDNTRETGFVSSLKDGFGFIQCCDRDARLFFHFSELVDSEQEVHYSDEVQFTVMEDQSSRRSNAIRVRVLPQGSINLEPSTEDVYTGKIEQEPSLWVSRSPRKGERERDSESGLIACYIDEKRTILPFISTDNDPRSMAKFGDEIDFQIYESARNGYRMAVNVVVKKRNSETTHYGFVATLKESFGFLEIADHEKEVFFRYNDCECDIDDLNLGDEIQFNLTSKAGKTAAEKLVKLPTGTIPQETVISEVYEGRVLRPLRRADPQQVHYQGLIEFIEKHHEDEGNTEEDISFSTIPYGITGLVDKRTMLQCGEKVEFRIGKLEGEDRTFAVEIEAKRERMRALVESVKGDYGFIAYETDESKNLFFHTSEIEDEHIMIKNGDLVEFCIIHNPRTGKISASKISLVDERQRPERLIRKSLSTNTDDQNNKFYILRQPNGPDNTIGFKHSRALELVEPREECVAEEENEELQ